MATKEKKNEINFKGKKVSIGVDMHKRSWHITALAGREILLAITLSSFFNGIPFTTIRKSKRRS